MKRLLIDASHILKACLHSAASGPHATLVGPDVLPSAIDGYENWLGSLTKTLNHFNMVPSQVIFVKDGYASKQLRMQWLPTYKERPPGVEGFHDEFMKLQQMAQENLLSYGAVSVDKEYVEADDVIAALAEKLDCIIWSGDKDLLAAGDVFYQGEINPDKFLGIQKKHIVVYKSLVGDTSDKIPGANGFGEAAFIKMLTQFGDDSLDDMLDMLENRTLHELEGYVKDFKPFQKVLDNAETVYNSYLCAKFHHPGWELNWKAGYPKGDGTFPQWDLKIELVTKSMLTHDFISKFKKQLSELPWGPSFDIETWSDEESLAWGLANKTQRGPRLDLFGAHMAGFSITTGVNNNLVYYFPVDHAETDNVSLQDMETLLNCCDPSKPMFVWNAGCELPVVRNHMALKFDRGWLPNVYDAMIMKSYVDENTALGLKYSSGNYLGYDQVTFDEVTAGEAPGSTEGEEEDGEAGLVAGEAGSEEEEYVPLKRQMNELTGAEVVDYGADDSICTGALANLFDIIMRYEGTMYAFEENELAPPYLCAEAFLNGQRFDLNRIEELTIENAKKAAELKQQIDERLVKLEWTVGDSISGATFTDRMPGCLFDPAYNLSGSELKKVYKQITGEALKSNLRSVEKLAELMKEKAPELAAALILEEHEYDLEDSAKLQLRRFNGAAEELFVPRPELNLGSPKQMVNFLYTAMGFPVRLTGKISDKMREKARLEGRTAVGNPKGNESAIRHAIMYDLNGDKEKEELLLLLIKAKELKTDFGLYLKPYPKMPNPKDGMVHANPGLSRATSRRATPSGPNFTQVSKKSPIREAYVPPEDDLIWWSMDFSGQELRLTAERSQCPVMLSCYPKDGQAKDLHAVTAVQVAALSGQTFTYEQIASGYDDKEAPFQKEMKKARNDSKAVNFGDVYGQTEVGLAEKLLITVELAREIIAAKAAAFPGVAEWKEEVKARLLRDKFAVTLMGARKHLIFEGTWKDEHEIRSGINFEIQSPAGEQIKQVQRKFWERQIFERYEAGYAMAVHDEVNGWVTKKDLVPFLREAHQIMLEKYSTMEVPIESSIEIGNNFGSLINIGTKFDAEKLMEIAEGLKCQNAA